MWTFKLTTAAVTVAALTCSAAALPVRFGSMLGDAAKAVAVDPATGAVYVTGTRFRTAVAHNDVYIVKYSAAGVVQWARAFGGNGNDSGLDIAVAPTGNVYVTGYVQAAPGGPTQAFIAGVNPAGVMLPPVPFGGPADDAGRFIQVDPAGSLVVGGFTDTAAAGREFLVARFTPALGLVASAAWGLPNGDEPLGMAVGVNGVYLAGKSVNAAGDVDGIVARFSGAGLVFLNARPLTGIAGGTDWFSDVAVDVAGAVYVTGAQSTAALGSQIVTTKLTLTLGGVVWSNVFNATGAADDDWSNRIKTTNNGVVVGGASRGTFSAAADGVLVAYDPFGGLLAGSPWIYNFIDHDEVVDIAFNPVTNSVHALMYSDGPIGHDYATASLNGGVTNWVTRYDFFNHDEPADMSLTPAGNVVVTGRSEGPGTGFDWATGCYSGATGANLW